jgi:hypothetical protein
MVKWLAHQFNARVNSAETISGCDSFSRVLRRFGFNPERPLSFV